jgi:hypothetical protein
MTVVGVVGNFLNAGMAMPVAPQIPALFRQQPDLNYSFKDIVLRTVIDPKTIAPAVNARAEVVGCGHAAGRDRDHDRLSERPHGGRAIHDALAGCFCRAGNAAVSDRRLWVISYLVAQRTHELGVRRALGADSGILWLILRQGMAMGLEASGSAWRARL